MALALSYHVAFAFVFALSGSECLPFITLLCHCCGPTFAMPGYTCQAVLTLSSCLAFVIDATLPLLRGSASVIPHFICHVALPVTQCYRAALPLSGGFTALYHIASVMWHCYHLNVPLLSWCLPPSGVFGSVIQNCICHARLSLSQCLAFLMLLATVI